MSATIATSTRLGLVKPTSRRSPIEALLANSAISLPMFDAGNRFAADYLRTFGSIRISDPGRQRVDGSQRVNAAERSSGAYDAWNRAREAIDTAAGDTFGGMPASTVLVAFLIDETPLSAICAGLLNRTVSDKTLKGRIIRLLGMLVSHYQGNGLS